MDKSGRNRVLMLNVFVLTALTVGMGIVFFAQSNSALPSIQLSCSDSDGVNYSQQGTACLGGGFSGIGTCVTDFCVDSNTVKEYLCSNGTLVSLNHTCQFGCSAGACMSPVALSVFKNGTGSGLVTSVPAGINCGFDCSEQYTLGTNVTLFASPANGSVFAGWSGACSGTGGCFLIMDSFKTVTATFVLNQSGLVTLSVSKAGNGSGIVTSVPSGINCGADCSEQYTLGANVTLSAAPAVGSVFGGWSGACTGLGGCFLIMNSSKSVTATFVNQSVPSLPDLTIVSLSIFNKTCVGGNCSFEARAQVRNIGNAVAGNSSFGFSSAPLGGNMFVATPPLGVFQSVNLSAQYFFLSPGNYTLNAYTDWFSVVSESNEFNNQAAISFNLP